MPQPPSPSPSPSSFPFSTYHPCSTPLPPPILTYLSTLHHLRLNPDCPPTQPHSIPRPLLQAFKQLTAEEQIGYIRENIKYMESVVGRGRGEGKGGGKIEGTYKLADQQLQIQVKTQNGISLWCMNTRSRSSKIKLDVGNRVLVINYGDTRTQMVDLDNYLVHGQQGMFNRYIHLLPISNPDTKDPTINPNNNNNSNNNKKYKFHLNSTTYQQIYSHLWNCIIDIRNQQLLQLANIPVPDTNAQQQAIIDQQIYNKFQKQKKHILNQLSIKYMVFDNVLLQQRVNTSQIIVRQNTNKTKMFKLQVVTQMAAYRLREAYLTMSPSPLLIQQQILQEYTKTCHAVYSKYFLKQNSQAALYIMQVKSLTNQLMNNRLKSIVSIEDEKRYDQFVFMKGMESPLVTSFFRFQCGFLEGSERGPKLVVIGEFGLGEGLEVGMVVEFLADVGAGVVGGREHRKGLDQKAMRRKESLRSSIIREREIEAIDREDGPIGKQGKNSIKSASGQKQLMLQFAEPDAGKRTVRNRFLQQQQPQQQQKKQLTFYRHKFVLQPLSDYNIEANCLKQNVLKYNWKRKQDGSLICTDERLLNEHKKIFKHVLSSMGSNILKGGNIMNVSLPVTIFKKQGHLQMIADSFSIAPKLFENMTNPLQRIKKALIISVAVGTFGISAQKPFFPTLGQTLQVWIGGCPMYMQQILRYPPTGAYIFYGRGYRIHGQVEPKISFGVNGAKGYSQRPSYIQFDDGQVMELSYSKMVISGIIMGDREFNFYDKNFVYDKKANIFAELIFGPKQTKLFGKDSQTKDFFYGKIYKLTQQFLTKFDKEPAPKPYPSKKYIQDTLSQFQGYWNGEVKFDGKLIFDFQKDMPCIVEPQQYALPSDTRFRKDLVNLIAGDIETAQREKELLEEGQRRDRKLRQQLGKNK